ARPTPNWEEIKWRDDEGVPNPAIEAALKDYLDGGTGYQDIVGPETAIETFEGNLRRLIMMVKSWAPMKRPTVWSKAWWTAEITELRRVYTSAARRVRRDGSGVQERDEARKVYRKAIVTAKRKHWDDFLASAKKNDVWTAHQFTKVRYPTRVPGGHSNIPEETSQLIMQHFFPENPEPVSTRPPAWQNLTDDERVTMEEVSGALEKCRNKSAPGRDQVPYGVWKNIHRLNGEIIPLLAGDLLRWGIHPPSLKGSLGIILPKPNKKDYTDCASVRVIALMQTLSKITERIINKRLIAIAYKAGLYCINQTGSLPQRSTTDAVVSLSNWIKEAQFAKQKVSTVFLDVKGGFDNVNHQKLLDILTSEEEVPNYITNWISNFISSSEVSLVYPGSPRRADQVKIGIPQGSPLSPLLFIIYVKKLHLEVDSEKFFTSSYVDDFQITSASSSWYRNIKLLEEKVVEMNAIAASLGLSFSIAKTELMHWRTAREKGDRSE